MGTLGAPIPWKTEEGLDVLGASWGNFEDTMKASKWDNLLQAYHYATSVILM